MLIHTGGNQNYGNQSVMPNLNFQFNSASNVIIKNLVFQLNKVRASVKNKKLYRSKLGDQIANDLIQMQSQSVSNDPNFNQSVEQMGLLCLDSEFYVLQQPLQSSGLQVSSQDMQRNFEQMLEYQVTLSQVKQKLVSQSHYTHISMTAIMTQQQQSPDVLVLGILLFKSAFTIEKVLESQQNDGVIITGKVLDSNIKPCLVVLNSHQNNQRCVVGPNRIYYDAANGDDYKVYVPQDYLRMSRHPLQSCQFPLIELYGVSVSERSWKNANDMDYQQKEQDIDQNVDPYQLGLKAGFRAFQVPSEDYKGLSMSITEALNPNTTLLDAPMRAQKSGQVQNRSQRQPGAPPQSFLNRMQNRGNAAASTNTISNAQSQGQVIEIKKTKAQILKEQNAAQRIQQAAQNTTIVNQSARFGGNSNNYNRPSAFVNNNASQNNDMSFSIGATAVNASNNNNFSNNQNNRWQQQQPRSQLNSTFCRSPIADNNQTTAFRPINNNNNFNAYNQPQQQNYRQSTTPPWQQSQPPQIPKFNFQPTKPQTQQPTPVFNQQFNKGGFPNNWQWNQNQSQNQNQNPFANANQNNASQFTTNNFSTWQQQPQQTQQRQQAPHFQPMSNTSSGNFFRVGPAQSSSFVASSAGGGSAGVPQVQMQGDSYFNDGTQPQQLMNQTPLPVRFTVNGTQSKVFNSKRSHKDVSLLPIQTQNELIASEIEFNSLSISDQNVLRGYLNEMCGYGCTQEELENSEKLMYTNPMQFYQIYISAKAAIQVQEEEQKLKEGKKPLSEKEQQSVQEKPLISVQDFSPIHLFLINFAEKNCLCSRYIDTPKNTKKILQAVTDNDLSAQEGLQEIILSKPIPRNDSFVKMYRQRQHHPSSQQEDLVLVLHHEKFKCHQIVMQQSSEYMRKAMNINQEVNMQRLGKRLSMMTFDLPEWVQPAALENFIRFSYTTEFKMQRTGTSAMRKERPDESLQLFRIACYFYCDALQECLLAREIIPNMNAYSAILFLVELCSYQTHQNGAVAPSSSASSSYRKREPSERVRIFLQDYCMFYLAKNLPVILRQPERNNLLKLPTQALYSLFNQSLFYIIDARADIAILLEFAAEIIAKGDIFGLYSTIHQRMENCCGFDQQHIPKISDIKSLEHSTQFSVEMMSGFDFTAIETSDLKSRERVRDSCALDASTEERLLDKKQKLAGATTQLDASNVKANDAFSPKHNIFTHFDGQSDTQEIKDPTFEVVIDLKEPDNAKHIGSDKVGLSFFSEAFDVSRRSWHLKVDIAQPSGNISLWIFERGESLAQTGDLQILHRSVPIKFSSQFMEMMIVDPGLKHRKNVIFYSFSHDKNQIIGHKNFANMDQLANKEKLTIRVKISENIIHSAMMHHFASIFQRTFKEECTLEQTIKMCPQVIKSKPGLFTQPIQMIYWLLSSDILKVEDENTVLSFIFHYTNLLGERRSPQIAVQAVDMLTKCLRFNFLDFYNLMSAIRKNSSIQASTVLQDLFQKEMQQRFKLEKPGIIRRLSLSAKEEIKPIEELVFCGPARKYFNMQKLESQGRQKLLKSNGSGSSSQNVNGMLAEELFKWAFDSKIQELDSHRARLTAPYQMHQQQHPQSYYGTQSANHVQQLQREINEEKIKHQNTARELYEFKIKYEIALSQANSNCGQQQQRRGVPATSVGQGYQTATNHQPTSYYTHQHHNNNNLMTNPTYNPQQPHQSSSPPLYQPNQPNTASYNNAVNAKENQPPAALSSKLGIVGNATAANVANGMSKQPAGGGLYVQTPPVPIVSKRDPPAGLLANSAGTQQPPRRRQAPASLINKSSSALGGVGNHPSFTSLNLSTNTLPLAPEDNKKERRAPPASLGGGAGAGNTNNTSMDLSAIMNKLNQSPAPSTLKHQRVAPQSKAAQQNSKQGNIYLTGKNSGGNKAAEACNIF